MLSRRDIEKELGKGINIFPVHQDNFKENSINLSTSQYAWTMGDGYVVHRNKDQFQLVTATANHRGGKSFSKGRTCIYSLSDGTKYIILLPHTTTLIETEEVLGVASNIGGALHSKVGLVAKGLGHIGTMLGPGFCGHLLISIHNITDGVIALKVGTTFASLSFEYLTTSVSRTSATTSGHVDKFAGLGISISSEEAEHLTEDWKSNIEGIHGKMVSSSEYKAYREAIRANWWNELRKYISWRNTIALALSMLGFVLLYLLAKYADSKLIAPVWVDRFWNVGCSGVVVVFISWLYRFITDKK